MALDKIVHRYSRIRESNLARLVNLNPYVLISKKGSDSVFVQGGMFYNAAGHPLSKGQLPDWVISALNSLTPSTRREVGLPAVPQEDEEADDAE